MIYRVIIQISYNDAYFDFDDMNEAGEFAKKALIHGVDSEDSRKKKYVTIRVIDTTETEQED